MGVYEVKTRLSEIVEYVATGHELTITKHGKPVARIVPAASSGSPRKRGAAKSASFYMSDDFDAPLEDFAEYQ